ncbi:50S ribosomal protein L11 methyltransferase [Taibaiella soli]|uniref:Ribosomal protein L11 methyltransferase n=1 Tax=Taibaiella soli TaxID=1649169 RepID=A0A2W2BBA3_9BACT|nr:50S ribosomal protein L11 methyltransferase [Taibaiella soli]PZF73469.1 50S ribosomal protein L11 methyltransferase [Taibaiella soli]
MQYIQFSISVSDAQLRELLIAQLAEQNFEAFEETDNELLAYIQEEQLDRAAFEQLLADSNQPAFTETVIKQQNWNAQWEESFQPVIVPGICTVRATFHDIKVDTPHEIVITPKMSFGTGHHSTTQLMMQEMAEIDFKGKSVFDFGSGTGILAILAEQMGASEVIGIDNDEWSYENAIENAEQNKCKNVKIMLGTIDLVGGTQFDVILANINRHILLQYMSDMFAGLVENGKILMSGLLTDDFDIINESAIQVGFKLLGKHELNNWIVLLYQK